MLNWAKTTKGFLVMLLSIIFKSHVQFIYLISFADSFTVAIVKMLIYCLLILWKKFFETQSYNIAFKLGLLGIVKTIWCQIYPLSVKMCINGMEYVTLYCFKSCKTVASIYGYGFRKLASRLIWLVGQVLGHLLEEFGVQKQMLIEWVI